jgi:hypothetical protein
MPWYQYPITGGAYGTPDPYGGFPKPDVNIAVPAGMPITSLFSGTVTGINSPTGIVPAYGNAVTIKLDNPVNPIATHAAYIHMASVAPGLQVGQKVAAGTVIGYSGGNNPGAGLQQAPIGFALYNGDVYGYGPSWSQYLGSSALDPTNLITALASGSPLNTLDNFFSSNSGSQMVSQPGTPFFETLLQKAGLFLLALTLMLAGFYILFQKQIDHAVGSGAKVAAKVALA